MKIKRQRNPALASHPLVVGGKPWDADVILDCCPRASAGISAERLQGNDTGDRRDDPKWQVEHRRWAKRVF